MNYKFAVPLEKYDMKTGSDTRNFKVKKTEDKVVLRFDEENQVFYAKIENPSQHTRYLFQQHRLAISLSKLNTGKSQRKHMCEKQWTESEQQYTPGMKIKRNYHPRWSRCEHVFSPVTSLDDEIELSYFNYQLKPNQRRTIGEIHNGKWFTSIKALLISCYTDATQIQSNYTCSCRGYKTMSNRIKIRYDENEDIIKERVPRVYVGSGVNHYHEYYDISANIAQNEREFTVTITSMGTRVLKAYNENRLWIGFEIQDAGYYVNRGGDGRRVRYGDTNASTPGKPLYERALKNRRYKNRINKKNYCPLRSRVIINNLTTTYTFSEDSYWSIIGSNTCLNRLLRGGHRVSTRYPKLIIGMNEGESGRRLFSYQTDVSISIYKNS